MTKAEIIAKYGEAHYEAQKAKNREKALQYYYDHPEKRATKEQQKERSAKWYYNPKNNAREKRRLERAAFIASLSPEEKKALHRKEYEQKLARRANSPEYDLNFREKARARHEAWREANREHVNKKSREWNEANRELRNAISVAAQARRRKVAGSPPTTELVAWIRSQPCVDCEATEKIEVGHIIPVKAGGTNDPTNLIPQCRPCNRRLSAKTHRLANPVA